VGTIGSVEKSLNLRVIQNSLVNLSDLREHHVEKTQNIQSSGLGSVFVLRIESFAFFSFLD
jgi:hypothetical protein